MQCLKSKANVFIVKATESKIDAADKEIAANVRYALRVADQSQVQLAAILGLSRSTMNRRLLARASFTAPELLRTAKHLAVPVTALLPAA